LLPVVNPFYGLRLCDFLLEQTFDIPLACLVLRFCLLPHSTSTTIITIKNPTAAIIHINPSIEKSIIPFTNVGAFPGLFLSPACDFHMGTRTVLTHAVVVQQINSAFSQLPT